MKPLSILCIATIILICGAAGAETIERQRTVVSADLDGNGTDEEIIFEIEKITKPTSLDRFHVTVNGIRSSFRGNDLTGELRVVDIDTTDHLLELAIPEYGPSDDHKSYFFRYINGALVEMGSIPGRLTGHSVSLSVNGGGVVVGNCRGSVLHTWFYPCNYRVTESHTLDAVPESYYPMGADLKLKDKLVLLAMPGGEEIVARLDSGDRIIVLGSDDIQWCKAETENHVVGWFELNNGWSLADNRSVISVFEGLCMAD